MKLFLTPGACSLSPHIALKEAGLPFDFEQVDLATKLTKSGADYRKVNPKGSSPCAGTRQRTNSYGRTRHSTVHRRSETSVEAGTTRPEASSAIAFRSG